MTGPRLPHLRQPGIFPVVAPVNLPNLRGGFDPGRLPMGVCRRQRSSSGLSGISPRGQSIPVARRLAAASPQRLAATDCRQWWLWPACWPGLMAGSTLAFAAAWSHSRKCRSHGDSVGSTHMAMLPARKATATTPAKMANPPVDMIAARLAPGRSGSGPCSPICCGWVPRPSPAR